MPLRLHQSFAARITAICLAAGCAASTLSFAADKPNVLMIVVDDLKPTMGCYGDSHARTPTLDKLAARGTIFTSAYANQAVCGPSRCSTFAGLRPDRTKVHDLETDFRAVSPWVTTLPRLFRDHGYFTAGCGKVFHGGAGDPIMVREAFDRFVHDGQLPYNPHHPKPAQEYQSRAAQDALLAMPPEDRDRWAPVRQALKRAKANTPTEALDLPDDAYIEGAIANQGIAFLDDAAKSGKPFFIAVGFKRPHLPFVAPKKYWDLHDPATLPKATYTSAPVGAPPYAMQNWGELRSYTDIPATGDLQPATAAALVHGYYASTSYMDAQLGRILGELDRRGLTGNTIIVLWSDHGWHLGDHGMWCKHTNYEQATRSVLMFAGPGIHQGKSSSALTELIDVFATTSELASLPVPANLDSRSLVPVLRGTAATHRTLAQSQFPRGNGVMGYAFRDTRYRYVAWTDRPDPKSAPSTMPALRAEELYDYQADPLETRNLASDAAQQETVASFRKATEAFIRDQAQAIASQP